MIELDANHVYRVDGEVWPGVSEVLDPILELDGIPREALRAAADFGRHVHTAVDYFNRGILDRGALDPYLEPRVVAWEKFLAESGATVIESERMVRNARHRYAGTLDSAISWPRKFAHRGTKIKLGTVHICDVKSGAVPRTVGPQTEAYRQASIDEIDGLSPVRYCVQLREDGSYRLEKLESTIDWSIFVSCLNIHRWRNGKNAG